MKKVTTNGPIKLRRISMSSFLSNSISEFVQTYAKTAAMAIVLLIIDQFNVLKYSYKKACNMVLQAFVRMMLTTYTMLQVCNLRMP